MKKWFIWVFPDPARGYVKRSTQGCEARSPILEGLYGTICRNLHVLIHFWWQIIRWCDRWDITVDELLKLLSKTKIHISITLYESHNSKVMETHDHQLFGITPTDYRLPSKGSRFGGSHESISPGFRCLWLNYSGLDQSESSEEQLTGVVKVLRPAEKWLFIWKQQWQLLQKLE